MPEHAQPRSWEINGGALDTSQFLLRFETLACTSDGDTFQTSSSHSPLGCGHQMAMYIINQRSIQLVSLLGQRMRENARYQGKLIFVPVALETWVGRSGKISGQAFPHNLISPTEHPKV